MCARKKKSAKNLWNFSFCLPFFSVVVFQFQEVISKENQQQIFYLLSTTQQLKVIFRVFDEKEVIMLTAPNEDKYTENDLKTFIREFITRMSNRFSINSITGGSGTISQDYTDIERSYQEALFVLQCQKKFPDLTAQLFNYRELGIYRYLDLILEKTDWSITKIIH